MRQSSLPPTRILSFLAVCLVAVAAVTARAQDEIPVEQAVITERMLSDKNVGATLVDEQQIGENPMMYAPETLWETPGKAPQEFVIDLGSEMHIGKILFWDMNGHSDIVVYSGSNGNWTELLKEDGVGYKTWKVHDGLDVHTRYLKVEKQTDGGAFSEMLVYRYTPEGSRMVEQAKAEAARQEAMISKAVAEKDNRPVVETGTLFGALPLVDEIKPGMETSHSFSQQPEGVSKVETILGKPCRVLPNVGEEIKYFAYRLGEGKYLEPGKAYLMTVEFPDDAPRSFHIANRGADMTRGIQTGQTLGDVIFTYTSTNMESLQVPLSNEYKTFQQLFWLNHRYNGIKQGRGDEEQRISSQVRGFEVVIGQPGAKQAPLSQGAAVARIRLFEVPNPERFNCPINFPKDLPRRHLFYREEMADGVINFREEEMRSVNNPTDWYIYHMRLMNFLGMNTFAKDLLEFGAPQHWDVVNPSWYNAHKFPHVWEEIIVEATKHGLDLLPYYEYAGSTGRQGRGHRGSKTVLPLNGDSYTHVKWAEKTRIDVTDPETWEEFKHILDLTVVKFKDKGEFVGIWLRPRISQMPMSFSDETLERFTGETGRDPLTREDLQDDETTLNAYYDWWFGKRKEFLIKVRDYLKSQGIGEDGGPDVLFMAVPKEPVPDIFVKGNHRVLVTDDPALWQEISTQHPDYENFYVIDVADVPKDQGYFQAITTPLRTWGSWEWNHAAPQADPQHFKDTEGILMTYPFNRMFTVNDPKALDAFRNDSGLAMIRHFPLNENSMDYVTGYYVCDFERIGPYQMMPEALAVANGDPWFIGYTSGHTFNRGFPEYARRFNANFLALPALPSEVVPNAASDDCVVVRKIETSGKGTYVAVVNTGFEPLKGVTVRLPKAGALVAAASGQTITVNGSSLTMDLEPFELKSILIQ